MRTLTGILLLTTTFLVAQERFEVAGWVDSFDFAQAKVNGKPYYDIETTEGSLRIMAHVQETGANTILWRNCGGATMRYGSKEESHHGDAPKDKRRFPDNREIYGWLRLGDMQPDALRYVFGVCRDRQLRAGV
ncbi:MAG: hypothetical protein HN849_22130, partial [Victivallales bacterium]|nr:hypothetical protein [Victivallales bacterium]